MCVWDGAVGCVCRGCVYMSMSFVMCERGTVNDVSVHLMCVSDCVLVGVYVVYVARGDMGSHSSLG